MPSWKTKLNKMQEFFSNEETSAMQEKLLEAIDPTNDYTYEQFVEEYGEATLRVDPEAYAASYKIPLSFVNKSNNPDPTYQTDGSSGFDLRANMEHPVMDIKAGKVMIVPTGLYFEIPPNMEIQIRPRSGLAAKDSVTVLNSPGTIDADYRGEIQVILINHGNKPFFIHNGDRIAQAVVANVTAKNFINLNKVDEISDAEDG
ncbi:MAG: dUTP diphosphatase [Candidatus Hodarchaeales archaeon]